MGKPGTIPTPNGQIVPFHEAIADLHGRQRRFFKVPRPVSRCLVLPLKRQSR
jgi:hypothetical protein